MKPPLESTLSRSYPKLCREWHPTANLPLTPDQVVPGSGKRVWWRCKYGHEWQTRIEHRAKSNSNCPYCARQRATKENNLAVVSPAIAAEWHPEKNGELVPADVLPKSNKKVWWRCSAGHEWLTAVAKRTEGTRCPYCAHSLPSAEFNLATEFPDIAAELHQTKNGRLPADQVLPSAAKRVWWHCPNGHDYEATPNKRTSGGGCPYCSNQRLGYGNSLADRFPEIANEWHPTKNEQLAPNQVVFGSNRKIWWQCARGHEWQTQINSRTRDKTGCPKCRPQVSKLELRIFAELQPIFGKIERQKKLWRKEFDLVIEPIKVCVEVDGYPWHEKKVEYDLLKLELCRKHGYQLFRVRDKRLPALDGHTITYAESSRHSQFHVVRSLAQLISKIVPMDKASHDKIAAYVDMSSWQNEAVYQKILAELPGPGIDRSISATHPRLQTEWHPTKNGALTPEMVSAGSGETVWWQCARGHEWATPVYAKKKCPYCRNLRATSENSLLALYPEVAKQWHPTKNHPITPDQVPAGSGKRYWWKCPKGHEWERQVEKRTKGKRGCPYCANRLLPRNREG